VHLSANRSGWFVKLREEQPPRTVCWGRCWSLKRRK